MLTNAVFIIGVCMLGFVVAHFVYGRFLSKTILRLDKTRRTPAYEFEDGIDFVPTRKSILFGHHFASIAGLGPILGPAIAVIWGWLPAILWVTIGTIFIGAVHDITTLAVSLRFKGRTIGDVTRDLIGPRARLLFLLIIFFLLALAMGVFAFVVAQLFVNINSTAVIPVFSLVLIASAVGVMVYKLKVSLVLSTVIGFVGMIAMIYVGMLHPVPMYKAFLSEETKAAVAKLEVTDAGIDTSIVPPVGDYFQTQAEEGPEDARQFNAMAARTVREAGERARTAWIWILLGYALVASILPVWLLLQPRDYLNSYQLYAGILLLLFGALIMHPQMSAPALRASAESGAPAIWPFLFIIVACGAISGFHSLVSSGTTVRQMRYETDAHTIGYGAMVVEGMLAILVIVACCAGFSQAEWQSAYGSYGAASGLAAKLGNFAHGASVLMSSLGIPPVFGASLIMVVVIAFAMTTLDTGTRLLRFNIEELARTFHLKVLANRYLASLIAVLALAYFALVKVGGKPAGLTLWTLFGASNQMLASLGLLAASVYLYRTRRPVWFTLVPMLVMLVMTVWAMGVNMLGFWDQIRKGGGAGPISLFCVGTLLIIMALWLFIEGAAVFIAKRRDLVLEDTPPEVFEEDPTETGHQTGIG
ncbi:MAG: carbon starvation protein A [Phycisphaerae bacterium]|jgi:carbon starvation protein|nr:carbon starvation protein A [Phycisphaerae bacterium]